jgi:MFS family permease
MSLPLKYPSEKDLERNRFWGIPEGATARTIFNLTSGAYLVGLLKAMGASDAVCGYILAIPVLAAVIQFLSPIVLESLPSKKRIILMGSMLHRLLLAILIIIPFLPLDRGIKLWSTGIIFFISYLAVSFVNPAISNFYVSFVPQNMRGKYFGSRESYILLSATVITLIVGKILDIYTEAGRELVGYIIVYGVIFVLALINILSYMKMKEVPLTHSHERLRIGEIFTLPFKNKVFINYFVMSILWNIAIQIASAYFSVYLKSDLGMNYTTITVLSMVNSVFYVLSARVWGRFADKTGWANTTRVTIGILAICHALWFLIAKGSPLVLLLLTATHIIGGIAWSGINVALFNLQFDFTPDEKRTVYIGFNAATSGIIGYFAAMVGSQLVSHFGKDKITLLGTAYDIKQILFIVSAILLAFCSLYISLFMRPKKNKAHSS